MDFQRSTLGEDFSSVIDSTLTVNLFPLSYESYANVYVDSVYFSNPFLLGNNNVELSVQLANSGNFDVDDVPVKVFINDIQVSNTTVSIGAADVYVQNFDLGDNLQSINRGRN